MTFATLPIVSLDIFLNEPPESQAVVSECRKAADALITYGALLVEDSRVSEDDNNAFLDLMEDYFAQPEEALRKDERPELGYQVGVTLENTEKPKCAVDEPCLQVITRLDPAERPLDITGHQPDPKCRFFWKMGDVPPYETKYPSLNAPNVVPENEEIKSRWVPTLEKWGNCMKNAVMGVAEMAALGLALPRETFIEASRYGPHLLAPTASDLKKYGQKDTILAGFHTDLNFLTIHGRSRYPGLNIWARNTGKRIPVKFPPTGRYLLVQAGKQLEHLSGGLVKAGYHEVVVNDSTLEVTEKRKHSHPDRPLIRISSTFFYHLSSDFDLDPIPLLADKARELRAQAIDLGTVAEDSEYPPMKVGQQVQNELRHIALMA
ncbi:Clavaminate synthase-like protein [Fomitiporia mediterranea MF3/22]|uniref:Clavaminate synthase-like protein n=1 Tax=Fomitiporia mediterranea (strain MF3/22) TaxID=694068 RepID=UPI00044083DD|nr:Clavaminate synthase-like protein [Fomitiporia mediterranea MF3/22]EJD04197.1 Clavaminate synthase-like protein [Fomitiporia mediterranea MF3/22]